MTRRPLSLAALVAVVLVVGGLSFVGTAEAATSKKPVRPKVGQCRTTTFTQGFAWSDPRKPVPCWKPHRMKTYAVVTVPKRFNLNKVHATQANRQKWDRYVSSVCGPKFLQALGGSFAARAQVAYTWWSFIPTAAERRKGARWLRCDLSLLATQPGGPSYVPPLPNYSFPMVGTRPITDVTRRCLANEGNDYWTTCNKPHVARADQTFVIQSATAPTKAAVEAKAAELCPGKRWTGPGGYGSIYVFTCYTKTTS